MNQEPCVFERIAAVEFQNLKDDLFQVRERVEKLEGTISRGVSLLVANLAGVVVMLLREML